jgi:hypothetical protein
MRHRKPADKRHHHGEPPLLTVIRTGTPLERSTPAPVPETGWLAATARAWRAFWSGGVAQLTAPVDEPAIRRLFRYYDAQERAWRVFLKHPLVKGSQAQEVLNPLARFALQLEDRIGHLERQFGITAKARADLGISFAGAQRSLEDLAREAHRRVEEVEG